MSSKKHSKVSLRVVGRRRTSLFLAVLVLMLLSFALRGYCLTAQSLWYDEGVSVRLAHMQLGTLLRWTANDIQPPLYYLLLLGWFRIGAPAAPNAVAFWLRFVSLFFGVLTVPLTYVFTKKILGETVGFTAVMLMTVSPMAVYYGQEGRMYTLFTFSILLSAYLMASILHTPHSLKSRQRLWGLLAISMAASLYIHYFSVFFIIAIYVYFFYVWWRTGKNTLYLIESVISSLVTLMLFSPWIPYLFHRYRVDTSYWKGTLKLHEALRHVIIALSLGKTVLEPVGVKLMWGFLAVWAMGMIMFLATLLVRKRRATPYPFILLLLYQIVPLVSILLLTYRTPKFNPRYMMPVLPAYLAWLAYAVIAPVWNERGRSKTGMLNGLISLASIGFLLLTMGYSLRNLYFDPAFTKPDFRSAADYIRSHFSDGETVILCSGHMFPVWNIYAKDLPQVRIPDIEVLDTAHPIGYEIANTLNEHVAGHKGVWLVLWQEDAVDPDGYLMDFMQRYGTKDGKDADFWHVKVRHFQLTPDTHFSSNPPIRHPLSVKFKGGLSLLGYTQAGSHVVLFWRADAPQKDLRIAYWMEDRGGVSWGRGKDRRPAAYDFPAFRWPIGKVIFGKLTIPAEPGTPPGDYNLCLRAYLPEGIAVPVLDEAGAPMSDFTCPVSVHLDEIVKGEVHPQHLIEEDVAPGVKLIGYDFSPPGKIFQGQPLDLKLYWSATASIPTDYRISLSMGENRTIVPVSESYPTSRWKPGDTVLTKLIYRVPAKATAGENAIEIMLVDAQGHAAGRAIELLKVDIPKAHRNFQVTQLEKDFKVTFGGKLELIGGEWKSSGDKLRVKLEWKALGEMQSELIGFVHGLDPSGKLVSQEDKKLLADGRPTTGWLPGEVVITSYELDNEKAIKELEIGVYRSTSHGPERITILGEGGKPHGTSFRMPK